MPAPGLASVSSPSLLSSPPAPGLPHRFALELYGDVRRSETADQPGTAEVPQVDEPLPDVDGVLGVAELVGHAGAVVHREEDGGSPGGGGGGWSSCRSR